MPDKEKILTLIDGMIKEAQEEPRWKTESALKCLKKELLKEQEAVEPILEQDSMVCRICGHEVIWQKTLGDGIWVDEKLNFCPHCGRKVKWND